MMSYLRNIKPVGWVIVAFALVQVAIIFFFANGPFVDEGITIIAGYRVFEGNVFADRYLAFFAGSPFVWPIFAVAGYIAGGLEGARLMALGFMIWTLIMFANATTYLFDEEVAFWSTLFLSLNGLYVALAHFAVYDVPAFAGLSTSFFC